MADDDKPDVGSIEEHEHETVLLGMATVEQITREFSRRGLAAVVIISTEQNSLLSYYTSQASATTTKVGLCHIAAQQFIAGDFGNNFNDPE